MPTSEGSRGDGKTYSVTSERVEYLEEVGDFQVDEDIYC